MCSMPEFRMICTFDHDEVSVVVACVLVASGGRLNNSGY